MKNLSLLLALLLMSACGEKGKDSIRLNGQIDGLGQDTLYLYGEDVYYDQIDTIVAENGKFSATLHTDTLTATRLLFKDGTSYPVFLDKGNRISIKGNTTDLSCLEISGNQPNAELTAFQKELKEGKDSLQRKDKAEAFIRTHPFSLVSLYLLDTYFVQQPQPNVKLIQELIKGMSGELKDRPYLGELEEKLKEVEKGQNGKSLPYFRLPNEQGKRISRTNFQDKYLLIHFWASWDSVSCRQNEVYRRIYRKESKNKQMAFIGISLDINPDDWKKSIRQDTLKWEQLCDFSCWENNLVKQLGIQAIPCNYLISPNGIIVDQNLDEKAIMQKIQEIETEKKENRKEPEKKLKKEPEKPSAEGRFKESERKELKQIKISSKL